jgi:hypothetical protein
MPLYTSIFPDKLARRSRFFKSLSLVDCRADEKFSIGASLPRHSARLIGKRLMRQPLESGLRVCRGGWRGSREGGETRNPEMQL